MQSKGAPQVAVFFRLGHHHTQAFFGSLYIVQAVRCFLPEKGDLVFKYKRTYCSAKKTQGVNKFTYQDTYTSLSVNMYNITPHLHKKQKPRFRSSLLQDKGIEKAACALKRSLYGTHANIIVLRPQDLHTSKLNPWRMHTVHQLLLSCIRASHVNAQMRASESALDLSGKIVGRTNNVPNYPKTHK